MFPPLKTSVYSLRSWHQCHPAIFTSYKYIKREARRVTTVLSQGRIKELEKGGWSLFLNLPKENWDPLGETFTSLNAVCDHLGVAKVFSERQTHELTQSLASKAASSAKKVSGMGNFRLVVKLLVLKLVISSCTLQLYKWEKCYSLFPETIFWYMGLG